MSATANLRNVQSRPLRLGDIVTKAGTSRETFVTRGVVVSLDVDGPIGHRSALVAATHGYRGTTTYTDFGVGDGPDDWQLVPWGEQSWEERVLSASASWREPEWANDSDLANYDPDSYGWALFEIFVTAMRPTSEDVFDWPTDWLELALDFARRLDGEMESTGAIVDSTKTRPRLATRSKP